MKCYWYAVKLKQLLLAARKPAALVLGTAPTVKVNVPTP